jgi:hypothetical protein
LISAIPKKLTCPPSGLTTMILRWISSTTVTP